MLSPGWLRCKEEVLVPMGLEGSPAGIQAWRHVRCAWPRTHRRGSLKCKFRFDDPGPPLRSLREKAYRVAPFVIGIYCVVAMILLATGVIR